MFQKHFSGKGLVASECENLIDRAAGCAFASDPEKAFGEIGQGVSCLVDAVQKLYDNMDQYGTMSEDLSEMTYQGAAFVPYTMTRQQIQELRQLAFKRFYSRPSYMLKRLLKMRTLHDVKVALQGVRSLLGVIFSKELKGKSSR